MQFLEEAERYNGYRVHRFELDSCNCIVVEPEQPLPGIRWVWKAEFFPAFPKFELEMLRRGYYLCYMDVGNTFGCPDAMRHFDCFYDRLTEKYHFSPYPILLGLSRGGLYVYNWACANPRKVGCVYADNPVCDFKSWPGGKGCGPGEELGWRNCQKAWKRGIKRWAVKSKSFTNMAPNTIHTVWKTRNRSWPLS